MRFVGYSTQCPNQICPTVIECTFGRCQVEISLSLDLVSVKRLCRCLETLIVCPWLFVAIKLYWNLKLFFFQILRIQIGSAAYLLMRLIRGRLWYTSFLEIFNGYVRFLSCLFGYSISKVLYLSGAQCYGLLHSVPLRKVPDPLFYVKHRWSDRCPDNALLDLWVVVCYVESGAFWICGWPLIFFAPGMLVQQSIDTAVVLEPLIHMMLCLRGSS